MNGIDIIYYDQDCNMKFISEHQQLCTECYNNSKKDSNYPYITIATDPSWVIMEYISYDNNSEIYIKCSHDQKYDQKYEHSYKEIYEKYTQEYTQEYEQEYEYRNSHQKLDTII